nr:unnamed protein product [Digitaria exilis]
MVLEAIHWGSSSRGCLEPDEASSDLQSRLRDIATWSLQNNAEESDANGLEQLESLLRNTLRDTKAKRV